MSRLEPGDTLDSGRVSGRLSRGRAGRHQRPGPRQQLTCGAAGRGAAAAWCNAALSETAAVARPHAAAAVARPPRILASHWPHVPAIRGCHWPSRGPRDPGSSRTFGGEPGTAGEKLPAATSRKVPDSAKTLPRCHSNAHTPPKVS